MSMYLMRIVSLRTIIMFLTHSLLFYVIVSCFQSKIQFFGYLICSKNFPKNHKKKNSRIKTLIEVTSYETPPPQNPKFHRLYPFLIFFSYSRKNPNKFALISFIWFLDFFCGIFFIWHVVIILLFFFVSKSEICNCWNKREIMIATYI